MFHTNLLSRLLLVAVIAAVVSATVGTAPAEASSKTGRFIVGLAVGALIGAALSDDDDCDRSYRHYDPPRYGGRGYDSPRRHYDNGYRDGYGDGRHEGYRYGYGDGRRDQYRQDTGYRYGPYSDYRPPCR